MPVPTRGELKKFCEIDDWEQLPTTDHYRYRKTLDNGDILSTKVSMGSNGDPAFNDPSLWSHVRRHQLGLDSEDEFWETLKTGNPPSRGEPEPEPEPPKPSLPTWLADYLIWRMGTAEEDVLELSEEEAVELYEKHIKGEIPN